VLSPQLLLLSVLPELEGDGAVLDGGGERDQECSEKGAEEAFLDGK
jgi:hypothetical protein